jgi:hypothetical protein
MSDRNESWGAAKAWFGWWAACGFIASLAAGAPLSEALLWGLGLGAFMGIAAYFAPFTFMAVSALIFVPAAIVLWPLEWLLDKAFGKGGKPPR